MHFPRSFKEELLQISSKFLERCLIRRPHSGNSPTSRALQIGRTEAADQLVDPIAELLVAADHVLHSQRQLGHLLFSFLARRNLSGPDGMPCMVLWRLEALDCRVQIPPDFGWFYPKTRPVRDSNPRPPAPESQTFSQLSYPCHCQLGRLLRPLRGLPVLHLGARTCSK